MNKRSGKGDEINAIKDDIKNNRIIRVKAPLL